MKMSIKGCLKMAHDNNITARQVGTERAGQLITAIIICYCPECRACLSQRQCRDSQSGKNYDNKTKLNWLVPKTDEILSGLEHFQVAFWRWQLVAEGIGCFIWFFFFLYFFFSLRIMCQLTFKLARDMQNTWPAVKRLKRQMLCDGWC